MRKKFKDVVKDIRYDIENYKLGYKSFCTKLPSSKVESLYKLGADIEEDRYPPYIFYVDIAAGIGYAATTVWNYFDKIDKIKARGVEAASEKLSEYYANLKTTLIEKYPMLEDALKDVNGADVITVTKNEYSSCYTIVGKEAFVKPGYENFFVDVRNSLWWKMEDDATDIINASTDYPTLTQWLTDPKAIAVALGIAAIPAFYYYGIPVLGNLALSASISSQHLIEWIHPSPTKAP